MERLSAWWTETELASHLRTPAMKAMGGALVVVALVSANVSAASRNVSWDVTGGRSAADQAWLDSLVGPITTAPGGAAVTDADPDLAVLPAGGDTNSLVVADGNTPAAPAAPVNGAPAGSTSVGTPALTANLLTSGIPVRVLKAYLAAASITTQKDPGCHLPWSLLAGIGRVESNHGRHGGSRVDDNGHIAPPIYGPRLDGGAGMALIRDTDGGRLDADTAFDRAVGPMQFLPGTWKGYQSDADADGYADPQDVDDAALTAAHYLCAGNGDLATQSGRWNAVLRYNHSVSYAAEVLSLADSYATGKVIAATAPPAGVSVPTTSGQQGGTTPATTGTTTLAPTVVPQVEQPPVPSLPAAPAVPAATPVTPAPDAPNPATTTPPAPTPTTAPAVPTTVAPPPSPTVDAALSPSLSASGTGAASATPSPTDPSAAASASASPGSPSGSASDSPSAAPTTSAGSPSASIDTTPASPATTSAAPTPPAAAADAVSPPASVAASAPVTTAAAPATTAAAPVTTAAAPVTSDAAPTSAPAGSSAPVPTSASAVVQPPADTTTAPAAVTAAPSSSAA